MVFARKFAFSLLVILFQLIFFSKISRGADMGISGHLLGGFVESPLSTEKDPIFLYRTSNGFVVFEKGKVTYQRVKVVEKKADPLLPFTFNPEKLEISNTVLFFNDVDPRCSLIGIEELPYNVNYFLSNITEGHKECEVYTSIIMKNVNTGIDVKYYFNDGKLKYDVIVNKGGNLADFGIKVIGDEIIDNVNKKSFRLNNYGFPIEDKISHSYQRINGKNVDVDVNFEIRSNEIKFSAENFNPHYALVIDPALNFSTYVGGSADDFEYTGGISKDASGNIVVTGRTLSMNFPTTAGVIQINSNGNLDCIVFKLNSTGTSMLFCTYVGGSNVDAGYTSLIDQSNGDIFIGGTTASPNFPITSGVYQNIYGGNLFDGFVLKLNSTGNTLFKSTFVGNGVQDLIASICFDNSGGIVFVGQTTGNFISTGTGYQNGYGGGPWDVFVGKINNSLSNVSATTMIGGNGDDHCHAVKVDASGNVYIAGMTSGSFPTTSGSYSTSYHGGVWDNYCAKFNSSLSQLLFSTYVGSSGNDWMWNSMEIDNSGNMYVTGYTNGVNFPTTPGVIQPSYGGGFFDAFIYKLNNLGNTLIYSTYFGGVGDDEGWGITLDNNYPLITGCFQMNMITTPCSFSTTNNGAKDAFVLKLNPSFNSIEYDSYFGGSNDEQGYNILIDGSDFVIAGATYSSDFPVTPGCFDGTSNGLNDFFVLKASTSSNGILPIAQFTTNSNGCIGTVFNFNNTSTSGVNYYWDFGDATSSTAFQPSHSYIQIGSYNVMLIVENCSGKDTVYQTIHIDPVPSPSFSYQDSCNGGLILVADSTASSYSWNFGGLGVSNLDSVYFNFGTSDSAIITLVTANSSGCSDTLSKLIYFQKKAVASFTTSVLPCTYEIVIDPDTTNSLIYNWNVGGVALQNSGQVFNVISNSIGSINIDLVVGSGGCKDSLSKSIILDSLPSAQFNVSQTCVNPVQFVNNSSFYNHLVWYFGDGDSSSLVSPNHHYFQNGSYDVTIIVSDLNGCNDTLMKTVNAFNPPTASFSTTSLLCSKSVQLLVDSLGQGIYQWNINGSQFSNLGQDFVFDFDSVGVFNIELIVDSAGCTDTLNKVVTIDSIPEASFSFITGCDTIVDFTNSSIDNVITYWDFGDGNSSSQINPSHYYVNDSVYTVTLIIENAKGCKDTLVQNISYHHPPVASFLSHVPPCTNEISFTVDSLGGTMYKWDIGGILLINNGQDFSVNLNSFGYIDVVLVVDSAGCTDTLQESIFVDSIPEAKFVIDKDCGNPIQFTNLSSGFDQVSWNFDDNDSSLANNPTHLFLNNGAYNVSLTVADSNGCKDTFSMLVNAHEKIIAEVLTSLDSCRGEYQFFVNPDSMVSSYLWWFGDGVSSNQNNPTHIYSELGLYNTMVILNSNSICADSIGAILDVKASKFDIPYLPNCFTPNSDGSNDFFEVEGNSLCDYESYSVFSRWGQMLFKSQSLFEKWDGKVDGVDLPEGVYVIIINGKKPYLSFVTILR